ncbi:MAG TPA: DUF4268 domain-containing protein [Bacteroidales bacterium]|nr:DUF4268 domain-containing protein [Bacteroidales bacterium]
MFNREEKKEINTKFWAGFKTYCYNKRIKRRWLMSRISIKSTQLKFYADHEKALVLFQIDNKSEEKRKEIYSYFYAFRKLWDKEAGEGLVWAENYDEIEQKTLSAIYFELKGVNMYKKEDYEKIYSFFASKMIILEDIYLEYKDVLSYQIAQI